MAKGNPMNGMLRGKIGDTIYSRKAGEQHSRAYVSHPSNPRTMKQTGQRVRFGTGAAFFRHAQQNLFRFAYEDQRRDESDYNAFMRHNIDTLCPEPRQFYAKGAPCIGDWKLTHGSLPSLDYKWATGGVENMMPVLRIGTHAVTQAGMTVQGLSRAMVQNCGCKDGDIITVVSLHTSALVAQTLANAIAYRGLCENEPVKPAVWDIRQFRLDVSDTSLLPEDCPLQFINDSPEYVKVDVPSTTADPAACGFAVIVSRPVKRGLKVSTARIVNNDATAKAVAFGKEQTWWWACTEIFYDATALDAMPENILQGSLLDVE